MSKKDTPEAAIHLEPIARETVSIAIKGTAPLIVHAWSQKAKQQMLDKQQGRKPAKELKDPQADFEASMYRCADNGHGFPTLAFKAATVGGARYFNGVTMTQLRQALYFHSDEGDLTRLQCSEPVMREDMVRVGMGTADIRYRAEYADWCASLRIEYVLSNISLDAIVALVDAGGMGGVGEWRPEKDGAYGTFQVVGA